MIGKEARWVEIRRTNKILDNLSNLFHTAKSELFEPELVIMHSRAMVDLLFELRKDVAEGCVSEININSVLGCQVIENNNVKYISVVFVREEDGK